MGSFRFTCRSAAVLGVCVYGVGQGRRVVAMPPDLFLANGGAIQIWDGNAYGMSYNSPLMIQERQNQQIRQEIDEILSQARSQGKPLLRRDAIENGLVGLGPRAAAMIQSETFAHSGMERDAFEVALFRIHHAPFNPSQRLVEWARARFHYVADPQAPFKPLPMEIVRVLNIPPGSLLFPHHIFYTVTWAPTHTRVPLALATDGKVQTLEDDGALLHFLRAEAGAAEPAAGRELLASAALFLSVARSEDLNDQVYPHTTAGRATVTAALTAPVSRTATLSFGAGGALEKLTTSP